MKTFLLIDGNSLQWRAAYSVGESKVASGVINYLCNLIEKTQPEKVIIFWDISKSRWRQDIYPEYKAKRAESKKDIDIDQVYSQVKLAKRLINLLGIRQIEVKGIEADDLIGWFAQYLYDTFKGHRIVVTTVDKDLWQLVNDRVIVLDFKTGYFVNSLYVQNELGISNTLIPDMKALSGDTSDNIPGVKGIGEKTAIDLLSKYGSLSGMLTQEAFLELAKSKKLAKILDSFPEVLIYYRITKLPTLSEMNVVMSEGEKSDLLDSISRVVIKDPMGTHLLRDFLDASVKLPKGDYTVYPHELSGISGYLGISNWDKTGSIPELDNRVRGCHKCSLRASCGQFGPTLASGGIGAEIMILGGNPDQSAWSSGIPFSGESSVILEKFFESTGITRDECWITYVCKCHSGGEPISHGNILRCMSNLREELDLVRPKFIIAFGEEAMSAITPHGSSLTKYVGQVFPNSVGLLGDIEARVTVLPCPTYIIRSKKLMAEFEYGCEKIAEFLEALS